jgi:protein-tyrosine-phosphatase
MKIIFVCKYNRFRSRVAEAYFRKVNKNRKIKAISRGFILGGASDKIQRAGASKIGVTINGKPKPIKLKEMIDADKIIVVANDIPKIMFNYSLSPISKKVIFWNVPDEQKRNKRNIDKSVNLIKKKVEILVKSLENKCF